MTRLGNYGNRVLGERPARPRRDLDAHARSLESENPVADRRVRFSVCEVAPSSFAARYIIEQRESEFRNYPSLSVANVRLGNVDTHWEAVNDGDEMSHMSR